MPEPDAYWKCRKWLFDSMLLHLSGADLKVALAIERRTTGHFAQEDAQISQSLLESMTGCSRNSIRQACRRLIKRGVVVETLPASNRHSARLKLNRDPAFWGSISGPRNLTLRNCTSEGEELILRGSETDL